MLKSAAVDDGSFSPNGLYTGSYPTCPGIPHPRHMGAHGRKDWPSQHLRAGGCLVVIEDSPIPNPGGGFVSHDVSLGSLAARLATTNE